MSNTQTKFNPLRDQLLVRPLPEEVNGLIVPDMGDKSGRRPQVGIILEAGPDVNSDLVEVGAHVLYWSHAGAAYRVSGQGVLRILTEGDLFGVFTEEDVPATVDAGLN